MKILGKNFLAFVTSGTTKQPVAGARTASFSDAYEEIDTSSWDGVSVELGPGKYTVTVSGLVDFTQSGSTNNFYSVANLYKNKTLIDWAFGFSTNDNVPQTLDTNEPMISGQGKFKDLKIDTSYNGAVEYSATISGVGDWTIS
ncbi:MAG TPA: hypothetical protein VK179_19550 [Bacteroidales bacterium]|nr:hypothetical protein [Bacteroidales bacterium]